MNLRTIPHLAEAFGVPAGLSDHSMGIAVPVAAVALGASIIEKHFTLARSDGGPDSAFSLEPHEFRAMVDEIRVAERALGRVRYEVTPAGSPRTRLPPLAVRGQGHRPGEPFTARTCGPSGRARFAAEAPGRSPRPPRRPCDSSRHALELGADRIKQNVQRPTYRGRIIEVISEQVPRCRRLRRLGRSRDSMLYLVGAWSGATSRGSCLRMAGGVLQARFVDPSVLGLFNGVGLVLGYAPFLQLGILNGLNRELPYFVGKGDRKRVMELAAAAQAWALAVGGLVGVSLLGVAVWQLLRGDLWMAAGWATNALMAVSLFYNTYYLQMTYRTAHDFARLAMAGVVENAVALVAVVLVAVLSFYGLCLRALLAAAVSAAILFYWRPVHVGPAWNFRQLVHLLLIGFPIFFVGPMLALWTVLDSTLVLKFAGPKGLGLYALAVMAGTTLEMLPMAVSQVIYPRMAERFGRTGKLGELVRMSLKPTVVTVAGMAAVAAVAWWLVGPVVGIVLPKYIGRRPRRAMGPFGRGGEQFWDSVERVQRRARQDLYAVAIVLGMGLLSAAWCG